ncbi:hypothetical protein MINS_40630 [Mycolicibacterium insubricum]|nr:hypothetical protein MINS_40630 [Mycolicibacterium insubricum]
MSFETLCGALSPVKDKSVWVGDCSASLTTRLLALSTTITPLPTATPSGWSNPAKGSTVAEPAAVEAPVAVVVVVAVADSVPAAVVAGPPVGPAAEVAAEVADGDDVSSCWQPATAGATATVSAVIAKANARGACFGMYALPPSAQ